MPYSVTLLFSKEHESKADSRNPVDHYRSTIASQVTTGQLLARLQPITDKNSAAPLKNCLVIQNKTEIISPTVELSDENGEIVVISKEDGFPALENRKIIVSRSLTINGDINFHTGNIDCPGDLLIKGSIMSGFKVKARNLTVTGSIENAEVQSSGNLICGGGIVACQDHPLICGANLWCKYLENSNIEVKKNIFIAGSSLHSFLKAGNNIVLCNSTAVLVGGKSEAGNSLYSGTLGAKWATPTEVILGCEPFLAKALRDQTLQRETIEGELNELQERIDQINIFLQHEEGQTTRHDALRLQEERELLESKLSFVSQKHKTTLTNFNNLKSQIAGFKKTNRDCILHVSKQLFSGVRLTIKDAEIRTEDESSSKTVMHEQQNEIITQ